MARTTALPMHPAYLSLRELPAAEAELAAARVLLPDDLQTTKLAAASAAAQGVARL